MHGEELRAVIVRRLLAIVGALTLAVVPAGAVTKWKSLQPGVTTRAEVDRVLGAPSRSITDRLIVYNPQEGTGRVVVEYREGSGIVNRIEIDLTSPLVRAALVETFALSGTSSTRQAAPDGALVEYFAGDALVVLFYADKTEDAGVLRVGFYSLELFNRVSGAATGTDRAPVAGGPQPGGPVPSSFPPTPGGFPPAAGGATPSPGSAPGTTAPAGAPVWNPKVETFNPAACQDIYYWAQREQDVARGAKNAVRRQQILDVLITSQRGDCVAARTKADQYKQTYR